MPVDRIGSMRPDTLPLLALKPETLFKRSAKTDAFVPRTAGSKDDLNDEFKTLASMDAWEQPFVTPPGVVQEVQTSASGGGAVRLTQIQDAASKDYINRWMNARPETIGVQYDDNRFGNHTMFEPLVSYQIEHSEDHPLLLAYKARRDALNSRECDPQTTNWLQQFNGVFTYSTDYLQYVPAFMTHTNMQYFRLPNVNEQILCHGTSVRFVKNILQTGFKATFEMSQNPENGGTNTKNAFTLGNYFADVAALADYYAKPFAGPAGLGNISCMIITRALLGCPLLTTKDQIGIGNNYFGEPTYQKFSSEIAYDTYEDYIRVKPEIAPNYSSSIIMGGKGGERSEFVTYGQDLALPVGLVFYRRGNNL